MTGIVPSSGRLDDIARGIHGDWARGKAAHGEMVDAYFAIGHQLRAARKLLPRDDVFGRWFKAQDFGFSRQWALTLRQAAEHESEVRAVVTSQLVTGRPNLEKAVKEVVAPKPKVEPAPIAPVGYKIKPPPAGPVQGPNDHTYDMDRWKEGLHCLPGCPGPEPHKVLEDVGVQGAPEGAAAGSELTDPATDPAPNPIVGEGESPARGDDETLEAHPAEPAVVVPQSPSPHDPPAVSGVVPTGLVGPVVNAVDASAAEPPTEDQWTLIIHGQNHNDFRWLCQRLEALKAHGPERSTLTWSYDGPASFTVDAQ